MHAQWIVEVIIYLIIWPESVYSANNYVLGQTKYFNCYILYLNFENTGPLLYKDNYTNATIVIGIVDLGIDCATPHEPGYYARVNQVLPWINAVIDNDRVCPQSKFKSVPSTYPTKNVNAVSSNTLATLSTRHAKRNTVEGLPNGIAYTTIKYPSYIFTIFPAIIYLISNFN